ncbi:MAG: internalization-related competence protein ComEC/Rec2 [Labilithrix sp.]|nr:internalization-related competence protein ComEC/Rec2 [Labilithrix sp.]
MGSASTIGGEARGPLDAVLVVGLGACAGGLAWAAPWPSALATAFVLVALARRGAPGLALLAALAFLGTAARASSVIWRYEHARSEVVEGTSRWPARCVASGVVARSPVLLGDAYKVDVDVRRGECDQGRFHGLVTLHVPVAGAPPLARGDEVEAIAQLAPGYRFWNEDTGDPRPAQARRGVLLSGGADDVIITRAGRGPGALVDHLRARLRARIVATFPRETCAMARALVLGEDDLGAADQTAFRRSGLAHLLAVSGMHLVLVVVTFVAALRAVLLRIPAVASGGVAAARIASAVGIPLAWVYADLAGASGSAFRAAWMTSLALAAALLARKPDPLRCFGVSIAGMVLLDPLVAFDLSFALSAAATAGLMGLGTRFAAPVLERLPERFQRLAPVVRALATSLAASVACAPVLACMTADLPVAGLVANLVAVPLGELAALPLCLLHALLEPSPAAESGCAIAASGALTLVRGVARVFAALPWAAAPVPVPTAGQLAVIGATVSGASAGLARRPRLWAASGAGLVLLLEVAASVRGSPHGELRVTFLDIGQGDGAIVDLPDGTALVIDGGGLVGSPVDTGERVLAPVLRARRRHSVAAALLSHPHPDHFGGLRRGLAAVRLGAFWDTGQGEHEGAGGDYAALLADLRARGVPIVRPDALCGSRDLGGARIDVLAPCPGPQDDRGANDNSFVVRITFGARSFLFMGDAEHASEHDLVADPRSRALLRADVLKVGHHGSRTSTTPELLRAVDPELAVISCGVRNRFGHPALPTLLALGHSRARLHRTDREGGLVVTTDGTNLDVRAAAE